MLHLSTSFNRWGGRKDWQRVLFALLRNCCRRSYCCFALAKLQWVGSVIPLTPRDIALLSISKKVDSVRMTRILMYLIFFAHVTDIYFFGFIHHEQNNSGVSFKNFFFKIKDHAKQSDRWVTLTKTQLKAVLPVLPASPCRFVRHCRYT